jgi:hypothetical protein
LQQASQNRVRELPGHGNPRLDMNATIKRRIEVIEHSGNENYSSEGTHYLSSHKLVA